MRADHVRRLRQETVDMFYHGYNNYMEHAFPEDEVRQCIVSMGMFKTANGCWNNSYDPSHADR